MKEEGSHYKWTESKVLLAYMCGRIYCGDYPERLKMETKTYWKFGMELFPDTELCVLFATSDIGQSKQKRPDRAEKFSENRHLFRVAFRLLFLFIIRRLSAHPNISLTLGITCYIIYANFLGSKDSLPSPQSWDDVHSRVTAR